MSDIFESKNVKPMLIGSSSEAFDSEDYIFELKLDGERCLAYLDQNGTDLRNKRNIKMLSKVPELAEIHRQAKIRCILDGELIVIKDGKPDFFEIQRRSLTSNKFKIRLQSNKYPASFTAYDILYYHDHEVVTLPLMERKRLLEDAVTENDRLAISRYIDNHGIDFYKLTEQNDLEGIVAKRKNSKYIFEKRSKDWIKIKNLQDDDFVVCGYIAKENNMTSIILGQYDGDDLIYKGHVTLGVSNLDFQTISNTKKLTSPYFKDTPPENQGSIWIEPRHVCTVKYMMKTATGSMRQPVFKGLRNDKEPRECVVG